MRIIAILIRIYLFFVNQIGTIFDDIRFYSIIYSYYNNNRGGRGNYYRNNGGYRNNNGGNNGGYRGNNNFRNRNFQHRNQGSTGIPLSDNANKANDKSAPQSKAPTQAPQAVAAGASKFKTHVLFFFYFFSNFHDSDTF